MVKLYTTTLLSLTLTTSLALAAPYPSYIHDRRDLLERDLDEEFSEREYPFASDDLEARDPNFFSDIGRVAKGVEKVAEKGFHAAEKVAKSPAFQKGLHIAEKVAENPYVQAASSLVPGIGPGLVVGERVLGAVGKAEGLLQKARTAGRVVHKIEGALQHRKGGKIEKHLGGAISKVKAISHAKHIAPAHHTTSSSAHHSAPRRHHRRDLEDNEELSRRRYLDEELYEREYEDFLVGRDFF